MDDKRISLRLLRGLGILVASAASFPRWTDWVWGVGGFFLLASAVLKSVLLPLGYSHLFGGGLTEIILEIVSSLIVGTLLVGFYRLIRWRRSVEAEAAV
jgi:hypothetical protein